MTDKTEKKLLEEIEEPEGFDMGDNFQMSIYEYGIDRGMEQTKKEILEKIDKWANKYADEMKDEIEELKKEIER